MVERELVMAMAEEREVKLKALQEHLDQAIASDIRFTDDQVEAYIDALFPCN